MKILALSAALALSACTVPITSPIVIPTPVSYAQRTAVDEQVAVNAESAYKAFRLALELGVDSGVLRGPRATVAAMADQRAYAALRVFRQAYRTANAKDFLAAARSANIAVEQAIATVRSK